MIEILQPIFRRDLLRLSEEISLYNNEDQIWKVEGNISNTAGNLCLHLIGNLNTFIGAEFGKTGYIRNRDLEFSQKNIPRQELLQQIAATINAVEKGLSNISELQLKEDYPKVVLGEKTSTEFFLIHLACHLSYHLGQINYHRRLLDK